MKQNNTPPPDVVAVQITEDRLTFNLEDGRSVSVPLAFYPTLLLASPRERARYEICHSSVYWPGLDCDISSECLLRGAREARKYAQKARRRVQSAVA
ncbi:MAG: DUF2442 domain-containing protein [Verrucomicrobia bacterium]|nr:DUF2442 domain-containing protein [Verrucomicrobiota bacterium]